MRMDDQVILDYDCLIHIRMRTQAGQMAAAVFAERTKELIRESHEEKTLRSGTS